MNAKAFSVFIQDLRDGRAHADLSAKLAELLAAVKTTGKAGSLTFKLKVKPANKGAEVDKVCVIDDISTTLPVLEHGDDFFYLTEENELSRNHPRQRSLDLREVVTTAPTQLKEVQG